MIAGNGGLDINDFEAHVKSRLKGRATSVMAPQSLVNEFLAGRHSITTRDGYAPVDNLMAPIFEERFGYNRRG